MFATRHVRRLLGIITAVSLAGAVAACGDDPVDEEQEPEIATMRLVVGAQTITVNESGTVTGGPITIGAAGATVTASFLRSNGTPDPLVTGAVFQLTVTSDNAGVATFTRTGPFTGTLAGTTNGSTVLRFALLHIEEAHEDFGPFPVSVSRQ